ncbi:reverse transcriptase domain-containing protein [Tanacetum coccineum]
MTTPVEKRNNNKFCEFHWEVGHNTDECMHLKRQIEELIKAGKLSHKGQSYGNSDGLAMAEGGQAKDHTKLLPRFGNFGPTLRDEDGWEGPMIIEAEMGGHFVHRIYVDEGSASEILYEHCFNRLHPEVKNQMVPATTPLIGFSGEFIWPMGQIFLLVKIGDAEHSTSTWMNFVVVRSLSPYNGIIGRPGVRKIQAVPSTAYGMLKFPVPGGILTLRSSRIIPLECTMVSGPEAQPSNVIRAAEERIKLKIHPEYLEQTVAIGSTLTEEGQKELCDLLRRNLDIFAWKSTNMTSVPCHVAEHRLNVREGCPPVRQKKRGQAPERNKAIQEEVERLLEAGIMKEVHYHSWLSNPVMDSTRDKHEAESKKMHLWGGGRKSAEIEYQAEEYDIQYMPRTSVKGQILADFIVEHGFGAGLILTNPEREEFTYALRFRFDATNNEAEYEALIASLRIAEQIGIKNLQANVDSRLVANQVNGSYIEKESGMMQYLEKMKTLASSPSGRAQQKKSINETEVLVVVEEEGDTWMTLIYEYLTEETLPTEKEKARVVRRKSRRMHAGTRFVVAKAIRTGYYWPTMHADARKMIRECQDCQSNNGDTPFLLTYGMEAVILAEIGMPTLRTAKIDMVQNDEALEINLDLLKERKEQAAKEQAANL